MSLIIVEGSDGAGKSTFARKLADSLGCDVRHAVPPRSHPLDEYELPLLGHRPGDDLVCDRWHLGELVYPRILGRETQMDPAVARHIELFLESRGAYVVVLTQKDDVLARNSSDDDLVTSRQAVLAQRAYVGMIAPPIRRIQGYPHAWELKRTLIDAAQRARDVRVLSRFVTYIGPPDPVALFLGDVRGPGNDVAGAPAFMPYPSTSGHFLLRALNGMWRYGIANACDVDDPYDLVRTLGYPPVVALGRNAHERLTYLNVHHGTAPHPQYVRRFHHHELPWYRDVLIAASRGEDKLPCRP